MMGYLERIAILDSQEAKRLKGFYNADIDKGNRIGKTAEEIAYQRQCVELLDKYFDRLDTLAEEYNLIDNVIEGKTTFEKELKEYRSAIKVYGILGSKLKRKKHVLESFEKDYLEPLNKCAEVFSEKKFKLEDVDTFPEARRIETVGAAACGLYSMYNFLVGNTETAISSLEAGALFGSIIEFILYTGGSVDPKFVKTVKSIDRKIKAVYNVNESV